MTQSARARERERERERASKRERNQGKYLQDNILFSARSVKWVRQYLTKTRTTHILKSRKNPGQHVPGDYGVLVLVLLPSLPVSISKNIVCFIYNHITNCDSWKSFASISTMITSLNLWQSQLAQEAHLSFHGKHWRIAARRSTVPHQQAQAELRL